MLVAALALAGGCATNPVTGRSELSLVSEQQELQMGREAYGPVIAEFGKYDDQALAAYVDSVGQRVAHASHLPKLEWHFTLVDDPAVNAFAMPGGYIYVTRGILANLGSEAQLAGVLGHEIGHVTHRHTAEAITRQQLYGLGLGVIQVAAPSLRPYGQAGEQALGLLFLSYSRGAENEADALGVQYATQAGYDPREIPATYSMLKRVGQAAGSTIPPYLSTHPDPGDREVRTTTLSAQAAAGKTGLVIGRHEYLRKLEGLVYGTDPREGYFEGRTFFHPGMNFQIDFPEGWKQQNTRVSVAAAEPNQHGLIQLGITPSGDASPEAYVQSLLRAGKIAQADGRREALGGLDAWVGRIAVAGDQGTVVLDAAFIRNTEQSLYQLLGESAVPGDDVDRKIVESMRSFRPIADSTRLQAAPARLHLTPAAKAGSLRAILTGLGPQGATPEQLAIANGVDLDQAITAGTTLKLVRAGRKH